MDEAAHPDIVEDLEKGEDRGGDGSRVHEPLGIMSTHVPGIAEVRVLWLAQYASGTLAASGPLQGLQAMLERQLDAGDALMHPVYIARRYCRPATPQRIFRHASSSYVKQSEWSD